MENRGIPQPEILKKSPTKSRILAGFMRGCGECKSGQEPELLYQGRDNVNSMTDFEMKTVDKLKEKFPDNLREIREFRGQVTILAETSRLMEILGFLKNEPELDYVFLADITAVDHFQQAPRFELVYQLRSFSNTGMMTVKALLGEEEKAPSAVSLWNTANWLEREIYDLFGIEFTNHPDLRRIVTPDHWELHPLRKDYPLRGVNEPLFPPTEDDV